MQFQVACVELDIGFAAHLPSKITTQNHAARVLQNLYGARAKQCFKNALVESRCNLRISLAMQRGVEIRKASADERVHRDEAIVHRFSIKWFQRSPLLCGEQVMVK